MLALIAACGAVAPATETAHPPARGTQLPVAPTSAATRPVSTTASDPWQPLRRPLVLPAMPAGAACPKTPSRAVNPDSGLFAAGGGPVYPAGLGVFSGTLARGRQIDGARDAQFAPANPASPSVGGGNAELQLTGNGDVASPSGWQRWNVYLETTAPGCYAFQIDGTSFSDVVVIAVVPG